VTPGWHLGGAKFFFTRIGFIGQTPAMADSPGGPPASPAIVQSSLPADAVFAMLADPVRRRLIETLAAGIPTRASSLAAGVGRRLDAALKHLTALRDAGLVVTQDDPRDRRRQLYSLSPNVTVGPTEGGQEIDFGCCVLRLRRA
jgi:DNA-binding transcriptional ArsR family regulator